jgi:hypothetical protein
MVPNLRVLHDTSFPSPLEAFLWVPFQGVNSNKRAFVEEKIKLRACHQEDGSRETRH